MIPTLSVRQHVVRAALAAVNLAVSVLHFLSFLQLAQDAIKIYRKMKSFFALASMVPLAMIELSFIIFIFSYYPRFADSRTLARKFMTVTGVQILIFPAIVLVRLLVHSALAVAAGASVFSLLSALDWIQFGPGLVGGLTLLIVSPRLLPPPPKPQI